MKKILVLGFLVLSVSLNAQLVVDDFKSGDLTNKTMGLGESDFMYQTGNSIIGKTRQIRAKVNQNPFNQNFQVAVKNGKIVISAAYDTRGTVYLGYGKDSNNKAAPMNLDLSSYKNLKIEYDGKSTVNGIFIALFTGTSRATYGKHVEAKEGKIVFTIPLKDFEKISPKYTLKDIDFIRFQFDSRSKTGCNMAINKIWFE